MSSTQSICPHCRAFVALDLATRPQKFQMHNAKNIVKMRPHLEYWPIDKKVELLREMFARDDFLIHQMRKRNKLLKLKWLNNQPVFYEKQS